MLYKLEIFVPTAHAEQLKHALFEVGAGRVGDYECCCWQTEGVGQFRPLKGAHPAIGTCDELTSLAETKIELVFQKAIFAAIIAVIHEVHPYETPVYLFFPVMDENSMKDEEKSF